VKRRLSTRILPASPQLELTGATSWYQSLRQALGLAIHRRVGAQSKGVFLSRASPVQEIEPPWDAKGGPVRGFHQRSRLVMSQAVVSPGPPNVEREYRRWGR